MSENVNRESLTGETLDALNRALDQSAAGDTEDLGDFTQYAKGARTEREMLALVAELDALPELSVVVGFSDGVQTVARKPLFRDFPRAVYGYWEIVGSELGTDSEELVHFCGKLVPVFTPDANEVAE
jgi:hypothetical protein